jgi:peptidoglycan/LPS O-acetylase OafA/YrhL
VSRSLSVYLDGLRFCAALWVLVGHATLLLPAIGLPSLDWSAEDAVVGFFVLSGFVIAHTSAEKHADLRDYAVARLSRLWSVAVPALLFAFLVDQIARDAAPALDPLWSDGRSPPVQLVGSLLFLNEIWFGSATPSANIPYWSVGYEFWYYALFGLAFYLRGRRRVVAVGAAALIAGPKILLLAPIWLMGVLAYHVVRGGRVGARLGVALFAGSIAAYLAAWLIELRPALEWRAALMVPGGIDLTWSSEFLWKTLAGAMAAANIVGFAAIAGRVRLRTIERPVRWLAGMTFSIYLFHWPLLMLVMMSAAALGWPDTWPAWWSLLVLAGLLAVIAGIAEFTERRKDGTRRVVEAAVALLVGGDVAAGRHGRHPGLPMLRR